MEAHTSAMTALSFVFQEWTNRSPPPAVRMSDLGRKTALLSGDPVLARIAARLGRVGSLMCQDRKSTRLNSSHVEISYAVFCLKKKKKKKKIQINTKKKKKKDKNRKIIIAI